MTKKILTVLSEFGFWGEELIGPMEKLEQAGYQLVFATPKGKRPRALPPSMDATYFDPPLGKPVTNPGFDRVAQVGRVGHDRMIPRGSETSPRRPRARQPS